ncbi:MAG: methyltransferase domain-containing protein [Thermoanaerobaculia bacterium]
MNVADQIRQGRLVCPVSQQALFAEGDELVTRDGARRYPLISGVPILHAERERIAAYRSHGGGQMHAEYSAKSRSWFRRVVTSLATPRSDMRSDGSRRAFAAVTTDLPADSLRLSIGGGPGRPHPSLTNLNVDLFANVDVVGDAYTLPYADESVDAIHCEAVLEHLEDPARALQEMYRVLRPGSPIYLATPFLQAYHAYPEHYQNYTLAGHNRLIENAGFSIAASGACVGPTFAMIDLVSYYLRSAFPGGRLGRVLWLGARMLGRIVLPLDKILNSRDEAALLASSVFALAVRPD